MNTHSTFVEQQLRILKMADDEMLLSLFAERNGVVQKRKTEKFELEMAIKKIKPLPGHLLYTYNCSSVGRTLLRMDFTSLKKIPQLETPVIICTGQEMRTRSIITT